jgi:hypothetical protein
MFAGLAGMAEVFVNSAGRWFPFSGIKRGIAEEIADRLLESYKNRFERS